MLLLASLPALASVAIFLLTLSLQPHRPSLMPAQEIRLTPTPSLNELAADGVRRAA